MFATFEIGTVKGMVPAQRNGQKPTFSVDKSAQNSNYSGIEKPKKQRSKTGCLTCRLRKKKCDEVHPICTYCDKRGISCEWEIKKFNPLIIKNSKEVQKPPSAMKSSEQSIVTSSPLNLAHYDDVLQSSVIQYSQNRDKTPEIPFSPPYFDLLAYHEANSQTPPMLMNLSSSFNLFLDDTGIFYLSYFEENVANLLSISPKSSNYFLKTFFTLSVTSESISNLLAAWGALFHQDSDLAVVNKYINRARASIKQNPTDRFDYFITMAYYLITIGIQVCSGDTSNWYQLFNKCEDLMRRYGGFLKFIKDFDYSNDCKFLIANFQFHDIMSSEALMKGTTCSMNSYNDLFKINKLLELDNYGIDPYQGCIQPIYLLLGEIMNNYVELKGERVKLNEKLNGDIIVEDPASLNFLRLDHFKKIDEKFFELTDKINYCSPIESQLQQLDSDGERAAHMKLFDLYKITCKMYLSLYIKQTQPISGEIQNHLVTALTLIHDLIKTDLISSLNMSLLICGISCCSKFDRMQLDATFDKVYSRYHVGNVKRIWDVVKEAWKRNASGNTCIDWIDICNDFGWKLSMC